MTYECGLDLREAVAREIMGVKVKHRRNGGEWLTDVGGWLTDVVIPGGVNQIDFVGKLTLGDLVGAVPPYECDMGAAWQVVEKMRPCDAPFWMNWWEAAFFTDDVRAIRTMTSAEAAHAICRAALKAVRGRQ